MWNNRLLIPTWVKRKSVLRFDLIILTTDQLSHLKAYCSRDPWSVHSAHVILDFGERSVEERDDFDNVSENADNEKLIHTGDWDFVRDAAFSHLPTREASS